MKMTIKTYYTMPKPGEATEKVSCPVCGRAEALLHWDCGSFRFSRCAGCGHIYQNPRPVAAALSERYDDGYKQYEIESADAFLKLMLLGLEDLGFETIEASLPREKAFLDVGCATGALVGSMAERGWRAVGVELNEGAARYGKERRGVDIRTGTLEDAAFPDGSFDLVHSSHFIEHVAEPGAYLEEVARILKPGGWCVTVTPTVDGLQARLFGKNWRSAIADHVHLFSARGLIRLASDKGFDTLKLKTWGGMAQGLAPMPIKRFLDRAAKRWGFGDVMAILSRKSPSLQRVVKRKYSFCVPEISLTLSPVPVGRARPSRGPRSSGTAGERQEDP